MTKDKAIEECLDCLCERKNAAGQYTLSTELLKSVLSLAYGYGELGGISAGGNSAIALVKDHLAKQL